MKVELLQALQSKLQFAQMRGAEVSNLTQILWADIFALRQTLIDIDDEDNPNSDCQRQRRIYFRSLYALIEGVCFSMKALALSTPTELSEEDRFLCSETAYELTTHGIPRKRNAKLGLIPNLRYSFSVLYRAFDLAIPSPDYSHLGFKCLRDGVTVRDRLMHPKSPTNLIVSRSELLSSAKVINWFSEEHSRVTTEALRQGPVLFSKALESLRSL